MLLLLLSLLGSCSNSQQLHHMASHGHSSPRHHHKKRPTPAQPLLSSNTSVAGNNHSDHASKPPPHQKQQHNDPHVLPQPPTAAAAGCTTTRRYTSSPWEKLWLDNVRAWQRSKQICDELDRRQVTYMKKFMTALCSSATNDPKWCALDDSGAKIFYNKEANLYTNKRPMSVRNIHAPRPVVPRDEEIFSFFTATTRCCSRMSNSTRGNCTYERRREYIEPLVSHLRHPLAKCQKPFYYGRKRPWLTTTRCFVVPPPPSLVSSLVDAGAKFYYFDAGATEWNSTKKLGGSSLEYFTSVFGRHGIDFDLVEAWEGSAAGNFFEKSIPDVYKNRTIFHHEYISTTPGKAPFVPSIIKERARKDDYVVFKLDIDSKAVETAIVEFLLVSEDLDWIDEFIWEHHVDNYLMNPNWANTIDETKDIRDSYAYFLKLRKRGIRAHSWV